VRNLEDKFQENRKVVQAQQRQIKDLQSEVETLQDENAKLKADLEHHLKV
jgi:predicted RNase H-like nuclease (RuvC/YqgF family)